MTAPLQAAARPRQRPDGPALTLGLGRWLRGAAVGASATCLALAGHVSAGGGIPAAAPFVALSVAAVLGAVSLSGKRWTLPSLLGVLLGAQVVFDLAFAEVTTSTGHHSTHAAAAHHSMATGGWGMLVAHGAAAVLTALLLRRGEDACWRAVQALARPVSVIRAFRAPRVPTPFSPPRAEGYHVVVLRSLLLVCAAPRRGPPVLRTS